MNSSQSFPLTAASREIQKRGARRMRTSGEIPAVVYGHGKKTKTVQVPYQAFARVFQSAGGSTLVDLQIDDAAPTPVLIHEVQVHPKTGKYLHADFHAIRMDEKITAETKLTFTGESPAVKDQGGVLIHGINALTISCLPKDLPSEIIVDLTSLVNFDAHIAVGDLSIPDGVNVVDKTETIVASVARPRTEEELAALDEKPEGGDVEDVEVEEKGKKEEDETEGAAEEKSDTTEATKETNTDSKEKKEQ